MNLQYFTLALSEYLMNLDYFTNISPSETSSVSDLR